MVCVVCCCARRSFACLWGITFPARVLAARAFVGARFRGLKKIVLVCVLVCVCVLFCVFLLPSLFFCAGSLSHIGGPFAPCGCLFLFVVVVLVVSWWFDNFVDAVCLPVVVTHVFLVG